MSEFDWRPVMDACNERIKLYKQNKDPWPNETVAAQGDPVCRCGKTLWFHQINRVKAPREGCEGFQLESVEVRVWRVVQLPIQTSS